MIRDIGMPSTSRATRRRTERSKSSISRAAASLAALAARTSVLSVLRMGLILRRRLTLNIVAHAARLRLERDVHVALDVGLDEVAQLLLLLPFCHVR